MLRFWIKALLVLAAGYLVAAHGALAESGRWIERSQIFHFPGTRNSEAFRIERRKVSAWNGQDEPILEFTWEPVTPPGLSENGRITGEGELTWRFAGTPDYSADDRYAVYLGALKDGKRSGNGEYRRYDGLSYVGGWKDDRFDGEGRLNLPNGDLYKGRFSDGRFGGYGVQTLHTGEVYKGDFRNGKRHGEGEVLTADGQTLKTRWADGVKLFEIAVLTTRNGQGAAALPTAGKESGQAANVDIGLSINQEMNKQFGDNGGVSYVHSVGAERIDIYPEKSAIAAHWSGKGSVNPYDYGPANSVILNGSFTAKQGARFRLEKILLKVDESKPFNKPFLEVGSNSGCVDFRPDFHFTNRGWGGVENASIEFSFGNEDGSEKSGRVFTATIGSFDAGTDVVVRDAVAEMGADVNALDRRTMDICENADQAESCLRRSMPKLPLGELAKYAYPSWSSAEIGVFGKISYQWTDASGAKKNETEEFSAPITLASLSFKQVLAECSDLPFFLPEPPKYIKVELPSNRKNYNAVIDTSLQAQSQVRAVLDISSDRSSVHMFRFGGQFSDHTEKMSKPIKMLFFKPRPFTDYDSINQVKLPACYIKEGGC